MRTFCLSLFFTLFLSPIAYSGEPAQVSLEARGYHPGDIFLVVVKNWDPGTLPQGKFNHRELQFFAAPSGEALAFAGIDLNMKLGSHPLKVRGKNIDKSAFTWSQDIDVKFKKFRTQKLKVDPNFVKPKKADAIRAGKEAKKLRAIFTSRTTERFFASNFVSPIKGAQSSRFGSRRVFNNVPKSPHSGADLRANAGTPILATAKGRVVLADHFFYPGKIVILDHGLGLFSLYAHLSSFDVKEGDIVEQGTSVGKVGATGRVTGAHLHWAVKLYNDRIDPFSLTHLNLDPYLTKKEIVAPLDTKKEISTGTTNP